MLSILMFHNACWPLLRNDIYTIHCWLYGFGQTKKEADLRSEGSDNKQCDQSLCLSAMPLCLKSHDVAQLLY